MSIAIHGWETELDALTHPKCPRSHFADKEGILAALTAELARLLQITDEFDRIYRLSAVRRVRRHITPREMQRPAPLFR